nr:hypothetical protein BaRGS_017240 [Batillaria attramentaria]
MAEFDFRRTLHLLDLCPEGANTFISNTNNAGRYYQCAQGVAVLMNCPNGTLWDQGSTSCTHDDSQQLGWSCALYQIIIIIIIIIVIVKSYSVFLRTGPVGGAGVAECPHQDCTKYISCAHGVASEMPCPPGTRFNPAVNFCDLEDNVPCDN